MMEQQDLTCERAISVDTACATATLQSKGKLAGSHKDCNLSRQRTATAECLKMVLQKKLEVVAVKVSNLDSESATTQKKIETSSKTHAEAEAGLPKHPGETRDDVEMGT